METRPWRRLCPPPRPSSIAARCSNDSQAQEQRDTLFCRPHVRNATENEGGTTSQPTLDPHGQDGPCSHHARPHAEVPQALRSSLVAQRDIGPERQTRRGTGSPPRRRRCRRMLRPWHRCPPHTRRQHRQRHLPGAFHVCDRETTKGPKGNNLNVKFFGIHSSTACDEERFGDHVGCIHDLTDDLPGRRCMAFVAGYCTTQFRAEAARANLAPEGRMHYRPPGSSRHRVRITLSTLCGGSIVVLSTYAL